MGKRGWLAGLGLVWWLGLAATAGAAGPDWQSLGPGLEASRDQGKPALVFIHLSYCGTCKAMQRKVLSQAKVIDQIHRHFVPVQIDFDQDRAQAEPFQVSEIPTFLVLGPDGHQRGRRSGYLGADTFLRFLDCARRDPTPEPCQAVLHD